MNPSSNLMPENPTTASLTLLRRVGECDSEACELLCLIYYPVVYRWARRAGCEHAFAEDVVQEVLLTVFTKVDPNFEGRFRSWLWSVFQSRMVDLIRRSRHHPRPVGGTTAHQAFLNNSALDEAEQVVDESIAERILSLKSEFSENVWTAFWRTTVHGDEAAHVAEDLGISVWAIYKAKKRCQARIRETLAAAGIETPEQFVV
ncbi:MAG: sigma-70 family RNA polymerase sigma factor [Planctomycetales bacterium]|nr:sigma-70 family RNA polymerase sigma factor [Planctomycetales bacterium]